MTEPLRFEPLEGRTPEGTLQDPMRRLCKFAYQCRICGKEHQADHVVARTVDGFHRPDNLMGAPLKLQGLGEDLP